MTHKNVSYWEAWPASTGRMPSARVLNRLARIYQCRAEDLLDGEDHTVQPESVQVTWRQDGAGADVLNQFDQESVNGDMDRRTLLGGLATAAVTPITAAQLLKVGFSAALGVRLPVDEWEHRVQSLGTDYMSIGVNKVRDRIAGDLAALQSQLETPRLWAVAARLLTTYGKTMNNRREAIQWYRLATIASDRSDDETTRVWVRGRSALALAYEAAEISTAHDLATQALAISDKPTLGRLNALVAIAHVAAVNGDRSAAVRHLDQARRTFDLAGSDDQVSDFAVPAWRFHTFASMLLSRLGDPRAVLEQDAADRTRPPELPRFATHIELHRALMFVKSGDADGGIAYADTALAKLPADRRSLSLNLMLSEIRQIAACSTPAAYRNSPVSRRRAG